MFAQNIDCGYTLEPPPRGGSNEYPQSMFWSKNKKNRYTPAYPSFFYIKVGFKGVYIARICFPDVYYKPTDDLIINFYNNFVLYPKLILICIQYIQSTLAIQSNVYTKISQSILTKSSKKQEQFSKCIWHIPTNLQL